MSIIQPGDDWSAAILNNAPGEVLRLAPGDHGHVVLTGRGLSAWRAVFAPLDKAALPQVRTLTMTDCQNIDFHQISFDSRIDTGSGRTTADLVVTRCQRIRFVGCAGVNVAEKMREAGDASVALSFSSFRDCAGIAVLGGTFSRYAQWCQVVSSADVLIHGNVVDKCQADGVRLINVSRGLVSHNRLTDWLGTDYSINHVDGLQIFNTDQGPCSDVTIARNLIDVRDGDKSQGIFIRSENAADPHSNITVAHNVVQILAYHGITVADTHNAAILNNLVPSSGLGPVAQPWVKLDGTATGVVSGNFAQSVTSGFGENAEIAPSDHAQHLTADLRAILPGSLYAANFGPDAPMA